jgi:serine/threonine protein kinase
MRYVDGTDLEKLVEQRGPLPVSMAVSCIVQAARGLECAHHRGIFHRDIKPKNLLLDHDGTVQILDLGLAKLDSSHALEGSSQITETGHLLGTIDYMAPEQAADMRLSDARSDIYSLGYTLWFLLTGAVPYSGSQRIERLMAHWEQPIPSLREACPAATEMLERVFTKMVAKQPADRYQTARDVITDLERFRIAEAAPEIPVAQANETQELQDFFAALAGTEPDPGPVAAVQVKPIQPVTFPGVNRAKADTARASTSVRRRASASRATRPYPRRLVASVTRLRILFLAVGIVITVIAIALLAWKIKDGQDQPVRAKTSGIFDLPYPAKFS